MKTPNEDGNQSRNMKLPKQRDSACNSGFGCHATLAPAKMRWLIGTIVMIAAGVMVVSAVVKGEVSSTQPSATAFVDAVAPQTTAGTVAPAKGSGTATPVAETSVGTIIGAFSELNSVAAKTDAVFIFLPGKIGVSGNPPSAAMKEALRTIESKGLKCGLFTLKAGSRDYDLIAAQMSVPGVLAMAKGRGMSAVSGDITEAKLVQGFVAACSPRGCGGGSCAPGAPGCK